MANPVTLVQLSPTMSEGTIVKWLVKEGDKISSGQQIVEIETDKAVMEQDSFFDGTLLKIIAKEGAKVPVEGVIAIVGQPGEDVSALGEATGRALPPRRGRLPPHLRNRPRPSPPMLPLRSPHIRAFLPLLRKPHLPQQGGSGCWRRRSHERWRRMPVLSFREFPAAAPRGA